MSSETSSKPSSTAFTEDEQHVAGNAQEFFKASQFDATLGILKKLQKLHPNDARLMHNRALTEFCKSNQTKVSEFRKNLIKIQKMLQQSHKEDEDIVGSGEKNNYMSLHYNQALLLYNMHQYSDSESILESLYDSCELTEDSFLLKICLLLADTQIAVHNPQKAGNVIANIEKVFLSVEEGNANQKPTNSEEKPKSAAIMSETEADNLRLYMRYLRSRCYLQQKSIKACKREIKLLGGITNPAATTQRTSMPNVASVFLKSNFEYVRCNYHKAYKLLGSNSPPLTSGNSPSSGFHDSISTLYYNNLGVIHFGMGKYNLGALYMQKALQENDAAVTTAQKQHQQQSGGGRHQQQSQKSLPILHMNKRYELLYNCGLQLLHAGKASSAFDCLAAVVPAFHSNPRLWLRLAECCIQKCTTCGMDEENINGKGHKKGFAPNQPIYTTVGAGSQRKVVVNTVATSIGGKSNNVVAPAPSFEFASVCLNNALAILQHSIGNVEVFLEQNRSNGVKSDGDKSSSFSSSPPVVQCPPAAPLSGDQLLHLYASVLTNAAFVALQLGNGLVALHHAQLLLRLPKLSGCHRYLGNMYAGEALVSLDRISEAIQHLSLDKINSVSCGLEDGGKKSPTSDDGSQKSDNSANQNSQKGLQRHRDVITAWHYPSSVGCAHAYMLVNLSTAHCLRSEFEKAQRLLRHAASLIAARQFPPQALLLAVYLALNGGGGSKAAVELLQRNTLTTTSRSNDGHRAFTAAATGNQTPASGGSGADSSASSTPSTGGSGRSKAGTPQPVSGGVTPERSVKAKGEGKSKRSRR